MYDYRLKVFYTVAKRLSFTKAAAELYVSQPAVTKHIKELENSLHVKLFHRQGSSINLTESGKILQSYAEKIRVLQRDLEYQLALIRHRQQGNLKVGASTTIAQYVLPERLARFRQSHPDVKIELISDNTDNISDLLKEGKIDIGIIEGASRSSFLQYTKFQRDEIVLVAKTAHPMTKRKLTSQDLPSIELVMREAGSGTQEFIETELGKAGISKKNLKVIVQLDSTESIKNYLLHSQAMAFLSINSVRQELKNNLLTVIDLGDFIIERDFAIINLKGEQSALIALFKNILLYN